MAKPKIFVSSTYYDLKNLRHDLENFIINQGYEPILHERGHIAYGKEISLENYCYREIEGCDILVAIIGGNRGTSSQFVNYSISNMELKTAIQKDKQVYVFVERTVYFEYQTYLRNMGKEGTKYYAVDDPKIYEFIHEIYSLPKNNVVSSFENSSDITNYLKEQWAGLFQRLLQNIGRHKEANLIEDLKNTSTTLKQLVTYLKQQKDDDNPYISNILLSNHPAFKRVKELLNIPYRVVFTCYEELSPLLEVRGFMEKVSLELAEVLGDFDDGILWINDKLNQTIKINPCIFDNNGKLKISTPEDWNNDWIVLEKIETKENTSDFDNDIPF